MASAGVETRPIASGWRDTRRGFGIVSRLFHWTMVALFLWQFTSALLHQFAPDTPAEALFWSMHYNFGFTLFCLAVLRAIWGLANFARRPLYPGPQPLPVLAGLVHFTLYLLMIAVPALALLRAYGSDRGLDVFGVPIFAPREVEIEGLQQLGSALHGELGWVLLGVVALHVSAASWHGFILRDGTLQRMTRGGPRPTSAGRR